MMAAGLATAGFIDLIYLLIYYTVKQNQTIQVIPLCKYWDHYFPLSAQLNLVEFIKCQKS